MGYKINFSSYSSNFAIPSTVVDDIKNVDGDYIKVILLILYNPTRYYSASLVSSLLHINNKKVDDAIKYWTTKGVLMSDDESSVSPVIIANTVTPVAPSSMSGAPKPNSIQNDEIVFLVQTIESFFGRPISSTEKSNISAIYQTLNLPIDVIVMAFQYCQTIDKLSVAYAQKVCINWTEKGIDTHEKVENYLKTISEKSMCENQIKMTFGISRTLSDAEKVYVYRWFEEYLFDISVIKIAYDKAINQIQNAPFAYVNKILENWYQLGLKTSDEINNYLNINKKTDTTKTSSYNLEDIDNLMHDNWPNF